MKNGSKLGASEICLGFCAYREAKEFEPPFGYKSKKGPLSTIL